MIYLASPYSHKHAYMRALRYKAVEKFVAERFGHAIIFSPILYTHHMARRQELPTDAASWKFFNDQMMNLATIMWVLMIPGWKESLGVQNEIAYANDIGLPIEYIEA